MQLQARNHRGGRQGGERSRGRKVLRPTSRAPDIRISRQYQQKHTFVTIEPPMLTFGNDVEPYNLDGFIYLKESLNAAKSGLDEYYKRAEVDLAFKTDFIKFQNVIDIYKHLRAEIERQFGAKPVTNAWMKYWELYNQYDLVPTTGTVPPTTGTVPPTTGTFTAFFNAELPGAALCAFNHYMKTKRRGVAFDWRASSLIARGDDSTALGDTYGIYEKNKDKWLMGSGDSKQQNHYFNDGDATNIDNLLDFAARIGPASAFGGVDLYSHDAGMDVSSDFNNQELTNAKLHLGCALAGFLTLKLGGTFIAKQYTFFETFTWNLLLIYARLFDEFYLCKPLTSRPYNSEIYIVGKGFKGCPDDIRELLIDKLVNFDKQPPVAFVQPDGILSSSGLANLLRFARIIFEQQTNTLKENIELFKTYTPDALRRGLADFKKERGLMWLKCYPITAIAPADVLPSNL